MTADPSIPANPGALTPAWLTEALRSTGTIGNARVTSCHIERVGEGKGYSGQIARVKLEYDLAPPSAPRSMIAKFLPPLAPEMRAALQRMYEKEMHFYREVAHDIPLHTPRMYYSDLDLDIGGVLLLEDLAPAMTLDILEGCTAEDAAVTIRHLAAFHAAWWEHPRLRDMSWLPAFDEQAENDQVQYSQCWEMFLQKVGALVPEGIVSLGARLRDHVAAVKRSLGKPPQTMLHGDFHLNNLLFDSTSDSRTVAVIDWQACSRGRGLRDLAYFLVTSLPPERRRAHERDLLTLYHNCLVEHGVAEYPFEQCLHDYRFSMLDVLYVLVMIIAHVDFSVTETTRRLRDLVLERACAAILDHNARDLLQE